MTALALFLLPYHACKDTEPACAHWATVGECHSNPSFMSTACCESCGAGANQPSAHSEEADECVEEVTDKLTLARFVHATNEDFIDAFAAGRAREFVPRQPVGVVAPDGTLSLLQPRARRFFTYSSNNGWNNQLLDLLCAMDMSRLLNRTLIIPTYQWRRRRGPAEISVARLLNLLRLNRALPVIAGAYISPMPCLFFARVSLVLRLCLYLAYISHTSCRGRDGIGGNGAS